MIALVLAAVLASPAPSPSPTLPPPAVMAKAIEAWRYRSEHCFYYPTSHGCPPRPPDSWYPTPPPTPTPQPSAQVERCWATVPSPQSFCQPRSTPTPHLKAIGEPAWVPET